MFKKLTIIVLMILISISAINGSTLIIPKPVKITESGTSFQLSEKLVIKTGYNDDYRINDTVNEIFNNLNIPLIQSKNADEFDVYLGITGDSNTENILRQYKINCPDKAEAYVLNTADNKIIIIGRDIPGLFYGLQTLKQFIKYNNDKKAFVSSVYIEDYPSLKFRGIHFFTGKNALNEQKNLVKIMSSWKMNYIVLQVDYIIYDKHPELNYPPFSQPKAEIKELIKFANDHFITVIPLLPTLGHVGYLFKAGSHIDLAEDINTKYCYTVTNPDTYKLLYDLFDELVELFKPEYFHIGHDEFTELINQQRRETSKKYSLNELLEMDIEKIFSYFEGKNISLMLWSDMFLYSNEGTDACNATSQEEASNRRKILKNIQQKYKIPKIVINDWHYNAGAEIPNDFKSLQVWKNAGFETIASAWSAPDNIRNFTRDAVLNKAFGFLQTTWAGYSFYIEDNINCHNQFSAYLLAADYSWSDRKENFSELPYNPEVIFWNTWYKTMYGKLFCSLSINDIPVKSIFNILIHNISEKSVDLSEKNDNVNLKIKYEYTNPFSEKLNLSISIVSPKPKGKSKFTLTIPPKSSGNIVKEFSFYKKDLHPFNPLKTEYKLDTGNVKIENISKELYPQYKYIAAKFENPIKLDCNLTKWQKAKKYIFNDKSYMQIGSENWNCDDLNAVVSFGYDDENIYAMFDVEDNIFHTNNKVESLWNGDSVQIALDFLNDKMDEYNSDDLEFGVSLVNNKPAVYSWVNYPSKFYNITDRIQAAVKNTGRHTIYEIKIPRNILGNQHKNRKEIGIAFVVNDDDGNGFKGGMASNKGLYNPKNPSQFSVLILD